MIISNLVGGLGNQMFQFACGRAVSVRTQQPFRLVVDQFREYQQHNGFELTRIFEINTPVATRAELTALLGFRTNSKVRRLLSKPLMSWATGGNWFNELHFDYCPAIQNIHKPIYLHGYWQSELYFSDIADIIRKDFTFCTKLSELDLAVAEKMGSGQCASIHVRRGDYLKRNLKNIHASLDLAYYVNAVSFLREKFSDIRFFAFSDEPDWVLKNLKPKFGQLEIVAHNVGSRSANDMYLMSCADHHIIANSSFSWWAAWLNRSKQKIIIAPKSWFANGRPTPTLVPQSWVRL